MASGSTNQRLISNAFGCIGFLLIIHLMSFESIAAVEIESCSNDSQVASKPLMVPLTIVQGAKEKGAVCLDGSPPAYHLHRGFGSGANNWLIHLEGGGWCNNIRTCVYRKSTSKGSSRFMERKREFSGILSNKQCYNPDFYNWNRVLIRYCDGASFSGESEIWVPKLYFRGKRIWRAAVEDLLAKGMSNVEQALLSGCSAGGLSSILHCDNFRMILPKSANVKCLSDAGLFLDTKDVSGVYRMRSFFNGTVTMQGVAKNLPTACTSQMDPIKCFFPQNLLPYIETPLFILNSAYDYWQVKESLAPPEADPEDKWRYCKEKLSECSLDQLETLQNFRMKMLKAVKPIKSSIDGGLFINSCYLHCQSEIQEIWFAPGSTTIQNTTIAQAVGDWYFDRSISKGIDCPFSCDGSCPTHKLKLME